MPPRIDLTGRKFGRLTVLGHPSKRGRMWYWRVRCRCGTEKDVDRSALVGGKTRSCGCLHREVSAAQARKHGMHDTPEYQAWISMKSRCYGRSDGSYDSYGGRGIEVVEEWRDDFTAFYEDVGPRPSPDHSLDRIDPDGDYEPGNVRWADPTTQARNTRTARTVVLDGEEASIYEASKLHGVDPETIWDRVERGWPHEKAVTTPTGGEQERGPDGKFVASWS